MVKNLVIKIIHFRKALSVFIGAIALQYTYAQETRPNVTGIPVAVENKMIAMESGDINNDGFMDIIIAVDYHRNYRTAAFYTFINNTKGTFNQPNKIADTPLGVRQKPAINLRDYNGDGYLDLMTADQGYIRNDV